MAQPPIEVDQITAAPAFDGSNITNIAGLTTNTFIGLQTIDTAPSVGGAGLRVHGNQPSIQIEDTALSTDPWDIRVTQNDFRVIDGASGMSIIALKGAGVGARNTMEILASDITFGGTSILYTTTTTTTEGVIELATQVEVDAGADTVRAVTPNTLANYSGLGGGVEKVMFTGFAQQPVTTNATRFSGISGRFAGQVAISGIVTEIVPFRPGNTGTVTLRDFVVKAPNEGTNGNTVVTILVNAVPTAVAVTITGTTTVMDTVNTLSITPNDILTLRWANAGSTGSFGEASWGFTVEQ